MTRELCLPVLQWKQTSTVNVRAGHCMYEPWPPSIVSSPTPKRTCSAWTLLSYKTQAMGSLSVCSSTEICGCKCHRMYDARVLRLSSLQLKRILGVQAGDCHCMYHPWPLFSCSSTESKLSSTVKASAKLAVSVVRLSLRVHEKKIAEMSKWWPFFPWFLRSSSSRFSKSAIILSLLHMAPFPAAPVSQFDRRMLDKISLQATETEESIMTRQQGLWKPTTTLTPALNADSIPRKKFFVFLVASAIEASSPRKTVSFTSSIPLQSDKKNAHGQRGAISVRGTSFHSETGLRLWLKRKPFPHLQTVARSKRNRRVPIETRRGPIVATAREASVRERHSRIWDPKHGANETRWVLIETRWVLIETRRVPIEATARQASVFG